MFNALHSWDVALFRHINQAWTSPWLDRFLGIIGDFHIFFIPLIVLGVGMAIFGGFKGRTLLVLFGFCLLIGDAGIGNGLKHAVHRRRPFQVLAGTRIVTPRGVEISNGNDKNPGRSFPSGHAYNNAALAMLVILIYGRRFWPIIFWPLLIGYSRVYTGAHYPIDVITAWILGASYAWAIAFAGNWIWKAWIAKKFPKLAEKYSTLVYS